MNGVSVRVRVGDEAYSVPVEHVLEVADLGEVARLPGSGTAVVGVRNLRGEVLPVFDLATLFGTKGDAEPKRIVVVEAEARRAGLAIDQVTDVGVLPAPEEETESQFLRGAALVDGSIVGAIDVPRLFDALEQAEDG